MKHALEMAQEAFDAAEVPVGCVFVYEGGQGEDDEREGGSRTGAEGEGKGWGKVISSKRNRTNELMNVSAQGR